MFKGKSNKKSKIFRSSVSTFIFLQTVVFPNIKANIFCGLLILPIMNSEKFFKNLTNLAALILKLFWRLKWQPAEQTRDVAESGPLDTNKSSLWLTLFKLHDLCHLELLVTLHSAVLNTMFVFEMLFIECKIHVNCFILRFAKLALSDSQEDLFVAWAEGSLHNFDCSVFLATAVSLV